MSVWILSLISFLLLGGFLVLFIMRFGVPDMVSDTFYQLQDCTGSEVIGGERSHDFSCVFSFVLLISSWLMMICIFDSGVGVQFLAFLGCGSLSFVALAPNYRDKDDYAVHKAGAIMSAIGSIGWCLSVCWWVTLLIIAIYILYLIAVDIARCASGIGIHAHPWFWAEVSGFLAVYLSYWLGVCH